MDYADLSDLADGAARLTGDPDQSPVVVVDLSTRPWPSPAVVDAAVAALTDRSAVTIGTASAALPEAAGPLLRALTLTLAPGGPGQTWIDAQDQLDTIVRTIGATPGAALTLAALLPAGEHMRVYDALQLESLAYSTLLAGPEYRAWRTATPSSPARSEGEPVLMSRTGDDLRVTLNRPDRHNAFGRALRDGLIDALDLALLDTSITSVTLDGAGPSFCSGGDLDEFGTAKDPVSSHLVRLARSAGWRAHQLRHRLTVRLHGACIGAGIEVPSFAGRVEARPDTWFRLPEISMGLIPGAGGTVSLPRRIGRWRTAYLALSGARLDVVTARDWGLIDAIL